MRRSVTRRGVDGFARSIHPRSGRAGWRTHAFRRLLVEPLEDRRLLNSDWGDLPWPYPTLAAQNGARHEIVAGFHLGGFGDAEQDGEPTADVTGDDLHLLAGAASDGELADQHLVTISDGRLANVFDRVFKELVLAFPDGTTEQVLLGGTAVVMVDTDLEGTAADTDGDGRDQVSTELLGLNLIGTSSLGPVHVGLDPTRRSLGEHEELANNTPGILDLPPFTATGVADSFFDVFLDIEIAGQVLHTVDPERLQAVISHEPPAPGETYTMLNSLPLRLWDANGNPTGLSILSERLMLRPPPELKPIVERFPLVQKELVLQLSAGGTEAVLLSGTATVEILTDASGVAVDTDGDGRDQVSTELVELNLSGASSLGPILVSLDYARRSLGEIEEHANNLPGTLDVPPFTATGTADSFFDVFLQIEIGGQVYHTFDAEHLQTVLAQLPPVPGETYKTPENMRPIPLLDYYGQPTGAAIVSEWLTPNPEHEVDHFPLVQTRTAPASWTWLRGPRGSTWIRARPSRLPTTTGGTSPPWPMRAGRTPSAKAAACGWMPACPRTTSGLSGMNGILTAMACTTMRQASVPRFPQPTWMGRPTSRWAGHRPDAVGRHGERSGRRGGVDGRAVAAGSEPPAGD